ncbi:MAG TPA: flagellar basal body-associated FliL family protein [Acidobacteriota bacterium]|nr:flagellar basal body-associated FliL family protein [Acidobacteriota bacterium]
MKSIVLIVGVVGLMAAAAFFVTTHVIRPAFAPTGTAHATKDEEPAATKDKSKGKNTKDDGREDQGPGEVYLVSDLLVNPTGTSGTRYLSATVGLEVGSPKVVGKLEERAVQVRDILISILSARSVDQLTDFQAREQMRGEIRERLNRLLGSDELLAVYFVDYVLQ